MKNKIVVDIHTHSLASGHSYGTVRENAFAAKEVGLTGMGVSEHAPGIPGTCEPIYFNNIKSIPRCLYGVNIYYGIENNVLNNGHMPIEGKILNNLDYCIVGIHGLCYKNEGIEKNTDNLIRCMENPKTFFVSHPDDSDYPVDYERLVLAAKQLGVALEVNNSTFVKGTRNNYLENIKTMLQLCMKHRTNVYIGSDAHDPSQIGKFDLAIEFLDEVGFDEDLIINNSEEKFRAFISFQE